MARTELDRRLFDLQAHVLALGSDVGTAIIGAMDALARRDQQAAQEIIDGDDAIDHACRLIQEQSAYAITLQQPAIRDLRTVLSVLAIAEDLERSGDYAEGIARLVLRLPFSPGTRAIAELASLATLARVQLQDALDAFRSQDAVRARSVWSGDGQVNDRYAQVVRALMTQMCRDEAALATDTYLLWVAHNLERIADRASNICERVVFIVTGERTIKTAS